MEKHSDALDERQQLETAIARVRDGDIKSFEVIVRLLERRLRAWLASHTPPGVDVDEVAQKSFIAAYTRLDDYTSGTDFASWLFTIAHYQLRTETTRLRRVADYHTRFAPDLLQRELQRRSAELTGLEQDRLDYLQDCLDGLGKNVRRYIDWRYEECIPLSEMARRSERSVAAVKKQLWQLRRALRDCVQTRLAREAGE